jgi:hypothetical protein
MRQGWVMNGIFVDFICLLSRIPLFGSRHTKIGQDEIVLFHATIFAVVDEGLCLVLLDFHVIHVVAYLTEVHVIKQGD